MRIGAIGDLTVDIILPGLRRSPEWGQEIEIEKSITRLGGNIGNMAVGACTLGSNFRIFSIIGKDEEGSFIKECLRVLDLDTTHVEVTDELGTSKTYACLREDGERFLLTYKGTLNDLDSIVAGASLEDIDVVFLGGWCSPPHVNLGTLLTSMKKWKADNKVIATDLIWSDEIWQQKGELIKYLNHVDIIFMNEDELRALTEADGFNEAIHRLEEILNLRKTKKRCVIKLGKKGAALLKSDGIIFTEAYPANPVDTVGAGDLFNIGFLHAFFQLGMKEEEALMFASAFASIYISRYYEEPPCKSDIFEAVEGMQVKYLERQNVAK